MRFIARLALSMAMIVVPSPSSVSSAEPPTLKETAQSEQDSSKGSSSRPVRDGRLFDPGISRVAPAEKAPPQLSQLLPWLGHWHVEMEIHRADEVLRSSGRASIHFMNRGHAIMERARFLDFDGQGHDIHTMTFYAVNPGGVWTASEGNSWTESITLVSGGFRSDTKAEKLVLHGAMRPGGGPQLLYFKRTHQVTDDGLAMHLELSSDIGETWSTAWVKRYRRASGEPTESFLPTRDDFGEAAPGRAPEAGQFDFLVGDFDADHWLLRGENELRWRSRSTAVHALGGHAILEFDWHDLDPSLPDAATTILRVYNRSMRRWENLFLTNRSQTPLYFGGVQEGDQLVLHPFDAQTAANPLSQWIFFEMKKDTYRWKGLQSVDRGSTWNATWTIDFKRRKTDFSRGNATQPGAS